MNSLPAPRATRALGTLAVLALLLAGTLLLRAGTAHAAQWMWLTLPDQTPLLAEVMISTEERARGMMFKSGYPDDQVMLFMYPADGPRQIWMKNCHFPLDVAWLDAAGRVTAVMERVPPCRRDPCPVYGPESPARHFVEGTVGWLERYGVREGSILGLGPLSPDRPR